MQKFILTLLSLVLALAVVKGQMHLISTYRIPSLTTEKCALSMNSKHIDFTLTSLIAYFGSFKLTMDKAFVFADNIEIMKHDPIDLDETDAFVGKTPLLIKETYLKGQHICYGMGGELPEPVTEKDRKVLAELMSLKDIKFALIDIEFDDMGLYFPSGKAMTWSIPVRFSRSISDRVVRSIKTIDINPTTVRTTTTTTEASSSASSGSNLYDVPTFDASIKESLHGYKPKTHKIEPLNSTLANEQGKIICFVNRISYLLGVNTNLTVQAIKSNLINEMEIMISNYQEFRDAMSSSALNTNMEWAGALETSYSVPEFVVMSQELLTMAPRDFTNIGQTNFIKDLFIMTRKISEKIGEAIALLSKSFIAFPQGTCVISSGLQLECLCFNQDAKWMKNVIIPTEISGKQLALDNFAYAVDSKPEDGYCFTFKTNNNLLLSNECCVALRKLQDNAIDFCPIIYTANWSPISSVKELNIIDNSHTGLTTTCGESVNKEVKNEDIYRLSLCEQVANSKNGKYSLPNLGKFIKDHLITAVSAWYDMSKFSQREILIMGLSGGASGILLCLIVLVSCIASPRLRKCMPAMCRMCQRCCKNKEVKAIGRSVESAPDYDAAHMPTFGSFGANVI